MLHKCYIEKHYIFDYIMDQFIPKSYITSYAIDILICISGKIFETYMKVQLFATLYLKENI